MSDDVTLRAVCEADLPIFFAHQSDPQAAAMAAFPSRDQAAFTQHWARIMADPSLITRTILAGGQVVGNIGSWQQSGEQELGYWLGRDYWGRGIATRALALFLDVVTVRPLHAYVATHNGGSLRVLEKCGFRVAGQIMDGEVELVILVLE
jgi:RimJ/RimL family protein N-acetyltransferase